MSANGNIVVFSSSANNLVDQDIRECLGPVGTQSCSDIFAFNRQLNTTEIVSISSSGVPGDGNSGSPSVSADGQVVVFWSDSTNLVDNEAAIALNVFIHDRVTRTTDKVSRSSSGEAGNGASTEPGLSDDGRFVVFSSIASNLVAGDNRDIWDIFLHDRVTGETKRVSTAVDGSAGNGDSTAPVISADGRYIAFWSFAGNLVTNDIESCTMGDGNQYNCGDVFVYDQETEGLVRIIANEPRGLGRCGYEIGISTDGRRVGFYNVIYDWQADTSEPGGIAPRFSGDGRYVAYIDGEIILRDRQTGTTLPINRAVDGAPSNGVDGYVPHFEGCSSGQLSLSANGQVLVFSSTATNLAPGPISQCQDILSNALRNCYNVLFYDRTMGTIQRVNVPRP